MAADFDSEMVYAAPTAEESPSKLRERKGNDRITTPYMTKYERARILGTRALQIRYILWLTTA